MGPTDVEVVQMGKLLSWGWFPMERLMSAGGDGCHNKIILQEDLWGPYAQVVSGGLCEQSDIASSLASHR